MMCSSFLEVSPHSGMVSSLRAGCSLSQLFYALLPRASIYICLFPFPFSSLPLFITVPILGLAPVSWDWLTPVAAIRQ